MDKLVNMFKVLFIPICFIAIALSLLLWNGYESLSYVSLMAALLVSIFGLVFFLFRVVTSTVSGGDWVLLIPLISVCLTLGLSA